MRTQNLNLYTLPTDWERGCNFFTECIWILVFKPIVGSFLPGSKWRKLILLIFGSKIGSFVRFNSGLKVKMPWKLIIDDFSWIGEDTWIDNVEFVKISKNVCIESNVWIGAMSTIGPGNKIGMGSVITIGSVVTQDIPNNSKFKNNKIFNLK